MHYEEPTQEIATQYEKELNEYFEEKVGNFEIYKIHFLCRFYRKIENSELEFRLSKLESLRDVLRTVKLDKNEYLKFDEIALFSITNLVENAILWNKLEREVELQFPSIIAFITSYVSGDNSKYECEFLTNVINELDAFTRSGYIPDYYGYKIILDFIDKLLDHLRDHAAEIANSKDKIIDQKSADLSTIRTRYIIDYLLRIHVKAVNSLKYNFKDIRHLEVRPVYLTYLESFVPIQWIDKNDNGALLFLDSSYTLPNNFDYIRKDLDYWSLYYHKGKLRALKNRFEAEIGKIVMSSKAESFEKKMQENEFKTVQIVALFVTVATFVFSSIKIFETKNGIESFGILIGMAACFILFNSAFNWIIQWQLHRQAINGRSIAFGILYVLLISGLLYLSFHILSKEDSKRIKEEEEFNGVKIDSVVRNGDTLIFEYFGHTAPPIPDQCDPLIPEQSDPLFL